MVKMPVSQREVVTAGKGGDGSKVKRKRKEKGGHATFLHKLPLVKDSKSSLRNKSLVHGMGDEGVFGKLNFHYTSNCGAEIQIQI